MGKPCSEQGCLSEWKPLLSSYISQDQGIDGEGWSRLLSQDDIPGQDMNKAG